ncbi:hypothetical protein LNQ03_08235 [Klebsiella pneumoniae subsp. pneumoniae]|nr:hypothetical protein [Klebsiella pneumoniae subsp. pneumoniae]
MAFKQIYPGSNLPAGCRTHRYRLLEQNHPPIASPTSRQLLAPAAAAGGLLAVTARCGVYL